MDPLFFAFAHVLQQHQLVQAEVARSRQERDEEEYKAWLLEERRKMISSAQNEANVLLGEASAFPERTFVKLQLILSSLDHLGAVPEEFDDPGEQENIVLLWRKLLNLVEKSQSQMTVEQMDHCQECLNAFTMENFIRTVASRLETYQACQELKSRLENLRNKNRKIKTYQKRSMVFVVILTIAAFLISASQVELTVNGLWVLWVLGGAGVGIVLYLLLEFLKPGDLRIIEWQYQQRSCEAQVADVDFWQAAKDKFGGIPSTDDLRRSWDEQEEIIKGIFGGPENPPLTNEDDKSNNR